MAKGFVIMIEVRYRNKNGDEGNSIDPLMIVRNEEKLKAYLKKIDGGFVLISYKMSYDGTFEVKECPKDLMEKDWPDCHKVFYVKDLDRDCEFDVIIYSREINMI